MTEKKVAVVTGAAGGLGVPICRALAREGMAIAVVDLDPKSTETAAQNLRDDGIEARAFAGDLSDVHVTEKMFKDIVTWSGKINVLINNAGISQSEPSRTLSPESWRRIIDVNLTSCFNCIRECIDSMEAAGGGAIVNLSSAAGLVAVPNRVAYVAAKHGVSGLTKAYAGDLGPLGIRVNAVAPGVIDTPMTSRFATNAEFQKAIKETVPLGKIGNAEQVAEVAAFLASDRASYVTGTIVPIDGGYMAEKSFVTSDVSIFMPGKK